MKAGFSKLAATAAAAVAFSFLALAPVPAVAQTTNLPPRTHSRETRMSIHAHQMQTRLTQEIKAARSHGKNVSLAQKHKDEGDRALETGHLRIAVEYYEAAEKALGK